MCCALLHVRKPQVPTCSQFTKCRTTASCIHSSHLCTTTRTGSQLLTLSAQASKREARLLTDSACSACNGMVVSSGQTRETPVPTDKLIKHEEPECEKGQPAVPLRAQALTAAFMRKTRDRQRSTCVAAPRTRSSHRAAQLEAHANTLTCAQKEARSSWHGQAASSQSLSAAVQLHQSAHAHCICSWLRCR